MSKMVSFYPQTAGHSWEVSLFGCISHSTPLGQWRMDTISPRNRRSEVLSLGYPMELNPVNFLNPGGMVSFFQKKKQKHQESRHSPQPPKETKRKPMELSPLHLLKPTGVVSFLTRKLPFGSALKGKPPRRNPPFRPCFFLP